MHRRSSDPRGTVTLFGMCCSRGVFGHAYLNRVGVVCGSGSGVECGDIVPLSESVCLTALIENPQGCSSNFPTCGRGQCSGWRVPVVARRRASAAVW